MQWVAASDGARLNLRTISHGQDRQGIGLLCLHGLFSDGRFFYNSGNSGPAAYFLEQGHQIYIGEFRGHGKSQGIDRKLPREWSFDHYVEQDIPCLIDHVCSIHQGPLYVIAHSLGGYALLASLGRLPHLQHRISGACIFSSAVNDYSEHALSKRIIFNASVALSQICGHFPSRFLRLGVSDAPYGLMRQFLEWANRSTFTNRHGDVDYWKALERVTVPVWAAVGSADKFHASPARAKKMLARLGSAEKIFIEPGLSSGFSRDFGHIDVIRSSAAAKEILPLLLAWIHGREIKGSCEGYQQNSSEAG